MWTRRRSSAFSTITSLGQVLKLDWQSSHFGDAVEGGPGGYEVDQLYDVARTGQFNGGCYIFVGEDDRRRGQLLGDGKQRALSVRVIGPRAVQAVNLIVGLA